MSMVHVNTILFQKKEYYKGFTKCIKNISQL